MPTPIEQTISIILDPASKLRDASPLVYCVPTDSVDQHEPHMRYFDLPDGDLSKTMRRWMMTEYGDALLQSEPIEDNADQSEIFAVIREPKTRWWQGVKEWMTCLPYYSWWANEKIMEQWPHFDRFTIAQHVTLDKVKGIKHFIKGDHKLAERFSKFCRKHRLRQYGKLEMVHNLEDTFPDRKKMLDQGVKQLRAWLKKNPEYQKRLDEYLEPDYKYWEKVENQI